MNYLLVFTLLVGSAVAAMYSISIFWRFSALVKFKGEFGNCIKWITLGLALLLVAIASSSTIQFLGENLKLTMLLGGSSGNSAANVLYPVENVTAVFHGSVGSAGSSL